MERSIQQEIQKQLERIGIASTDNNIGMGGGLDVDFDYDADSDLVKIDDSQEQTVFRAFDLFPVLEKMPEGADAEDFWNAAQSCVVE
jgi:hypothetical protein